MRAKNEKMASRKKLKKPQNRVREFFAALWGFWPVWSVILVVSSVFIFYQYSIDKPKSQPQLKISDKKNTPENSYSMKPENIKIIGNMRHLKSHDLKNLIIQKMVKGYLSSDLVLVRDALLKLPWIENANIRRILPDRIEVEVIEKTPLLRWKQKGLVSDSGELFFPSNLQNAQTQKKKFSELTQINVAKTHIKKALSFLKLVVPVISQLKLHLQALNEDDLGGWYVDINQNQKIIFGRNNLAQRILSLEKIWSAASKKGTIEYLDLRYANGGAVHFFENKT